MASSRIELRAGEELFREGDPPTSAFIIERGSIEILAQGGDGETIVLGRLGEGDLLGEMAIIDASPRTATARALTECTLTAIGRSQLQERIDNADPIVRALLRGQLQRYRSALATLRGETEVERGLDTPAEIDAHAGAMDKIRLEAELKEALERHALEVRFQPILEIATEHVAGFEALIRWNHAERGAISPAEFIRLAEETSLIVPVGIYVFEQVATALADLRRAGVTPLPFVAINVSARQLEQEDLLDHVRRICAASDIPIETIKIEITESLTLDLDRVGKLIAHCHELGMKVALDDFGTGFSNLGHLHKLRFDTIKLDQGFVRQMLHAPRCLAIVRAIVRMVDALDADLVAEGVETYDQLDALDQMGARYAQGFLIGRPLARADMLEFIRRPLAHVTD